MSSPEELRDSGTHRQSVITTAQSLLDERCEPREDYSILFDGEGWVSEFALATIAKKTYTRKTSLKIGDGYKCVIITEESTERFGRRTPGHLVLSGMSLDSEGKPVEEFWRYDLGIRYTTEEYANLQGLLESEEGEERDNIFFQIADSQHTQTPE